MALERLWDAVTDEATRPIAIGLSAVIVAVTNEEPRVLTVERAEHSLLPARSEAPSAHGSPRSALPFGPLDPAGDRTLELGLRSWVRQQAGLQLGYVEQLYTFGDRDRLAPLGRNSPRVLSVAYLALVREGSVGGAAGARWRNIYDFLPWEDGRDRRSADARKRIVGRLTRWAQASPDAETKARRRERIDVSFGLHGAPWDPDRVLDRYELLYESSGALADTVEPGEGMALDHRRILATALGRLRGKIRYRPVVFELLSSTFTLLALQRLVEALAGVRLHKQNFRRVVAAAGLVEGTGTLEGGTGGRPAELFRFRREVLRERLAPGVGRHTPRTGS